MVRTCAVIASLVVTVTACASANEQRASETEPTVVAPAATSARPSSASADTQAASSAVTASAEAGPSSAIVTPSVLDSIPAVNGAADRGCLDQPGVLHAPARDWYPGGDGSLALNGAARIAVGWSDPFQAAAEAAVQAVAPAFVRGSGFEYRASADGCATHRYAEFHSGDDDIVVAAWRVESAANPFWVPNEADFTTLNETTLVSQGSHIVVVLVVAPDGTTARVSAYGARAEALVSGWPTTAVPRPDAPEPGPTNFDVEQLVPIAQAALDQVTGAR